MEVCRKSSWLLLLLGVIFLATALQGVQGEAESEGPSESECRPYIEKALKELEAGEVGDDDSKEDVPTVEITTDDSDHDAGDGDDDAQKSAENEEGGDVQSTEKAEEAEDDGSNEESVEEAQADNSAENEEAAASAESKEDADDDQSDEKQDDVDAASAEAQAAEDAPEADDAESKEGADDADSKESDGADSKQEDDGNSEEAGDDAGSKEGDDSDSKEAAADDDSKEEAADDDSKEGVANDNSKEAAADDDSKEAAADEDSKEAAADDDSKEAAAADDDSEEAAAADQDSKEAAADDDSKEAAGDDNSAEKSAAGVESAENDEDSDSKEEAAESKENEDTKEESVEDAQDASAEQNAEAEKSDDSKEASAESKDDDDSKEDKKVGSVEDEKDDDQEEENKNDASKETDEGDGSDEKANGSDESGEPVEEDLTQETEVPSELRPREHVAQLLKLDDGSIETEKIVNRVADITLRELKKLYENAIKPLEVLYKYRDLSNRHFGDAEIFSKPLVLFMGPWSGGKSSIINYLLDNEYNDTALRTGAEPSPAYFNILMYGEEPEVLDGTQLAADFTFSGLQKFGQGLEERLKGHKLPSKLLEKINIVEIPGILEVRKQVSRVFPFNDACQWFIDRADIIFLVYDPSKLDVGPETEAILDQLKGREHQTRIVLNKADQVKPEELMRVQGALIWNISPLMSSAQPPIMYTTSLWSRPYEPWAPVRLLQAQERAFLRDLRSAYDKRIENKIASARRFAVRVRNHAKMVDCYLTTYYNHKSVFGNRKQVADEIIEHPQDYHIYEGLSTLTNISRYDLPDPDVYRDFFKLNPLYEFQQLSATCTYFRGCPINRLDVAIAYDLPELVGKHKRMVEAALAEAQQAAAPGS